MAKIPMTVEITVMKFHPYSRDFLVARNVLTLSMISFASFPNSVTNSDQQFLSNLKLFDAIN